MNVYRYLRRAIGAAICLSWFWGFTALGQPTTSAPDPVTSDPTTFDSAFPATSVGLAITSSGAPMNALAYLAQGNGPHPTVLLLHGFPGYDSNFDVAQAIRRAGWNVLMFHYRGSWGSGGDFSFGNVLEDVGAVLAYMRDPANAQRLRADPNDIVLIGHSLGGFAALTVGARDPNIRSIASISGWDVGLAGERAEANQQYRDRLLKFYQTTTALKVPAPDSMIKDWIAASSEWQLIKRADQLSKKSVLLVGASKDTTAPMAQNYVPLVQALRANKSDGLSEVVLDTDHLYSDQRIALTRAVVSWLMKQR
jgi:pimeloyl-ACP methyl ester carboxylesterase